jgi:hypothetical protein
MQRSAKREAEFKKREAELKAQAAQFETRIAKMQETHRRDIETRQARHQESLANLTKNRQA